jgi:xanthine dehydrogenase accessory factor
MFELAEQVRSWQAAGRRVMVARVVDTRGFSSDDPAAAVAATPGEPIAGTMLSGAADDQLTSLLDPDNAEPSVPPANAQPSVPPNFPPGRMVEVVVAESEALRSGLACGGTATLLIEPADHISDVAWQLLAGGEPCCLVTKLIDGKPALTEVFTSETIGDAVPSAPIATLFARGSSQTSLIQAGDHRVVATALWPVPTLLVVGDGLIAQALATFAGMLEWRPVTANDPDTATGHAHSLRAGDGVVVLSHDLAVAGPALRTALGGAVSYVGALGSLRTQAARADWLREHDVSEQQISRIYGPAGLDIGSRAPYEIAVAIVAELLAVRSGSTARSLRDGNGSIHRTRSVPGERP